MKNIEKIILLSFVFLSFGCSSNDHSETVTLSFRYAQLTYDQAKEPGYYFVEDIEYPNLIETFTYEYGHLINQDDYDDVVSSVSGFIPHNEGGYYLLTGFYRDMDSPSYSGMFKTGYECVDDVTFYYSYEGGNAQPSSETFFAFF